MPLHLLHLLLAAGSAMAGDAGEPDPFDTSRPVPVNLSFSSTGTDLALRIRFDRLPAGPTCGKRCANATVLIDTDGDAESGLSGSPQRPETGADLSVTLNGTRTYGSSDDVYIRATVRRLVSSMRAAEGGEILADFQQSTEPDRVHLEGNEVVVLVDVSNLTIPSGKTTRVIYPRPPAAALVVTGAGTAAEDTGKVEVLKGTRGKRGYQEQELAAPKKKKKKGG